MYYGNAPGQTPRSQPASPWTLATQRANFGMPDQEMAADRSRGAALPTNSRASRPLEPFGAAPQRTDFGMDPDFLRQLNSARETSGSGSRPVPGPTVTPQRTDFGMDPDFLRQQRSAGEAGGISSSRPSPAPPAPPVYYGNAPGQTPRNSGGLYARPLGPISSIQVPAGGQANSNVANWQANYFSTPQSQFNAATALWGNGDGARPTTIGTTTWLPEWMNGGSPNSNGNGNNSGQNGSGGGSNGNGISVTSTINPRPIYSPEAIARNTSQRVAQALAGGDERLLQQRFAGRGRSLDSGTRSAVMPAVAAAENAAAEAMVASPLQDWYANQANILQGQIGRAGESLGLANIMDNYQGAQQQQQLSLLMNLFGMMGGM